MRLRAVLGVLLCTAAIAAAGSVNPDGEQRARHVLDRLAYGPAPGELERLRSQGVEAYIDEQLHPERVREMPELERRLARLSTLALDPVELFAQYGPPRPARGETPDPAAIKAARERARVIVLEAAEARLVRAVESRRQLQELMVDFWFNHFNVFAGKGLDHLWIGAYEREAIRPYVFGRFRDLLGATAHHPAMLFYLDNWRNSAPGGRQGLNENYARELMELHTLGVDGGYTQADVIALARVFTGWTIAGPRRRAKGGFYFDARRHDAGDKLFLGQTIRAGGEREGEQALDILARHPATARHISYKLAQYFVADEPPPALVARLAQRYTETDGDIRALLATLFRSDEFWDAKYYAVKLKTPYQYLVSTLRASAVAWNETRPLYGALFQQGMPLYGCPTPNGYNNTTDAWLNPDALAKRINFATAVGTGRWPPASDMRMAHATPIPLDAAVIMRTLGDRFSPSTRAAIEGAPLQLRAALVLGSPEFMWH